MALALSALPASLGAQGLNPGEVLVRIETAHGNIDIATNVVATDAVAA